MVIWWNCDTMPYTKCRWQFGENFVCDLRSTHRTSRLLSMFLLSKMASYIHKRAHCFSSSNKIWKEWSPGTLLHMMPSTVPQMETTELCNYEIQNTNRMPRARSKWSHVNWACAHMFACKFCTAEIPAYKLCTNKRSHVVVKGQVLARNLFSVESKELCRTDPRRLHSN